MAGIKVPGVFTPGTVKGIVTESKYIAGTYIVVNTEEERISLSPNVAITGTRVYVIESEKEYVCTASEGWQEESTNEALTQAVNGLKIALENKQDTLISGTNIKTINGESILGAGNISISGGSGDAHVVQVATYNALPNIGDEHTVYFVVAENATYRFDVDGLKYVCMGRDYNDVTLINCGNAEDIRKWEERTH